jgi:hypothetical protein
MGDDCSGTVSDSPVKRCGDEQLVEALAAAAFPCQRMCPQVESYCDIVRCHETALQTKIMVGTAKDKNANLLGKRL